MLRILGDAEDDDTDSEVMSGDLGQEAAADSIVQRLLHYGIPEELLKKKQQGFLEYVREHPGQLRLLLTTMLPDAGGVQALTPPGSDESQLAMARQAVLCQCHEALNWLEWCAFGTEPRCALEDIRKQLGGARGVCGAVWGNSDIAYRCHTCEQDHTCAICVPCFRDGDHSAHDYVMIRTTGGCCDCGDATAWKESGFCSRHRGSGKVPPLSPVMVDTMRPVLEAVLLEWKDRLLAASQVAAGKARKWKSMTPEEKIASRLSMCVILMLLDYCNCSENMLNFAAENVSRKDIDLLDTLMTTERFLPKHVDNKLHELLYKLLGDPNFKYKFAMEFIGRYPKYLHDSLYEEPSPMRRREQPTILGSFSVQIFTVPTLTPRLVLESKLLDLLFGILKDFFISCVGEDGRFVTKPTTQDRVYVRTVEDLKYIMSHPKVAQYVIHEVPQLCRTWLQFLAFIQGMYPQKRITSIHIEEENEDWVSAFYLEAQMANIHPLFVAGTSLVPDDETKSGSSTKQLQHPEAYTAVEGITLPKALVWMISECVTVLDSWFAVDASRDSAKPFLDITQASQRRKVHRLATEADTRREVSRRRRSFVTPPADVQEREGSQETVAMEVDGSPASSLAAEDEWWMGTENTYGTGLNLLVSENEWPSSDFDVARQEVSFHIPLHRMLARLLLKALEVYEAEKDVVTSSSTAQCNFLLQLFPEAFQVPGFAALLMEHPLRLQVLCAQVQAGMWRRNGHTIVGLCDVYRSVQWCEISLELDLFILQCCAAMAPAEDFVGSVLSCFGLEDYFTLFLWRPNEYEPFLAQELLAFFIRIISERGFCGLSPEQSLRRELVQRLAVGDASRSVLLNAMPPRLQENKHLQEMLDAVAIYRRPHGMQQGKYILREESWRELDLYHPRWTPRELQSAEERYLRACRSSALFSQAPKWQSSCLPLRNLANVAVSAKLHDVLRAVFFHAAFSPNLFESRAPESLLFTALHLLSLGLDVCAAYPNKESGHGDKLMDCEAGNFEPSSPSSIARPPLLSQAAEYVHVGGSDGTQLPDRQSMLSLLVLLMKKYIVSEGQQLLMSEVAHCNVGSFIKNLLHRFAELDRQCMYAIETLAPEILHRVSANAPSKTTERPVAKTSEVEVSEVERKRALARERQAAMMAKMRAAQDKFIANVEKASAPKESKQEDVGSSKVEGKRPRKEAVDDETVCALCRDRTSTSPLCILVLVQRSRLLSLAQIPAPSWDSVSKDVDETWVLEAETGGVSQNSQNRGAENLISELRQWLEGTVGVGDRLERIENRDDFLELLRGELPSILNTDRFSASASSRAGSNSEMETSSEEHDTHDTAGGSLFASSSWWKVYPEESSFDSFDRHHGSVLAEYIKVVSRARDEVPQQVEETPRDTASRMRRVARNSMESKVYNSIGLNDFIGLHLSACGHAAHQDCVDRYHSSVLQRHYSRSLFEGVQIVDPDMGEFLCPVCRRLSNCSFPIMEGAPTLQEPMNETACGFQLEQARDLLFAAEYVMCKLDYRKSAVKAVPDPMRGVLDSVGARLCGLSYPEKDQLISNYDGRNFQCLFLWDVFRYSIMASELSARTKNLILGHQDAINRLVVLEEAADASKGSVLPLMFLIAKSAVAQSLRAVLLRTRAMQLMVGSICLGMSRDALSDKFLKGHGKGPVTADVQFWRRSADPVLAHDPFSSLLWVLLALPSNLPFYHQGPFISLVHVFYLVCVVQCIGVSKNTLSQDAGLPPKIGQLITTVNVALSPTILFPEDISQLKPPSVDDIRRLTLPYLRRCALLQTVCSAGAGSVVPTAGSNSWDLSVVHNLLAGSSLERSSAPADAELFELNEVEELEKRFQIPPLQVILADKTAHEFITTWFNHVKTEAGGRSFPGVLKPMRASPFQLMRLPHLFQDLLQRFVKERCPRCKNVPDRPALCLLCGALCCGSGPSGCCSSNLQSECYRHAIACGGGVGVYLMLKRTTVLLVRRERQSMWPSPYLDSFGEEDHELKRGKPLYLSTERYQTLTAMVASHSLDYTSSVLSHTTRETIL